MRILIKYFTDLLLVAGCACILYGLALWNIVITWIVAGGMLIGFGVMIAVMRAKALRSEKMTGSIKEKSVE